MPYMPAGRLPILYRCWHREVSIGNIPMLDPPVTTKPLEAQPTEQLMTQLSMMWMS